MTASTACMSSKIFRRTIFFGMSSHIDTICACKNLPRTISLSVHQHQQVRHKWIFKRRFEVGPVPEDVHGQRFARVSQYKQRHEILDTVECTHEKPLAPIDLLLLKDIPGVGIAGEVKSIPRLRARNEFIPQRMATYATAENVQEYADMIRERAHLIYKPSSSIAMFMVDHLRAMVLNVPLNMHHPWTLEVFHIRSALRRRGVWAPDEAFLKMPERPIVGPNRDMHGKCFTVTLLINGREKVGLLCRIQLVSKDPEEMKRLPVLDSGGETGVGYDEGRQYEEVFPGAIYRVLRPDEEYILLAKAEKSGVDDQQLHAKASN